MATNPTEEEAQLPPSLAVVDPDNIHNIIWNDSMGPGAARFIKKEYPVLVRLGKPLCFVKLEAIIRHLKNSPLPKPESLYFSRALVAEIVDLLVFIKSERDPDDEIVLALITGASMFSNTVEIYKSYVENFDPTQTGITYLLEGLIRFLHATSNKRNFPEPGDRMKVVGGILDGFKEETLQILALRHLLTNVKHLYSRIAVRLKNGEREGPTEHFLFNSLYVDFCLMENVINGMKSMTDEEMLSLRSMERVARLTFPNGHLVCYAANCVVKHAELPFMSTKMAENPGLVVDHPASDDPSPMLCERLFETFSFFESDDLEWTTSAVMSPKEFDAMYGKLSPCEDLLSIPVSPSIGVSAQENLPAQDPGKETVASEQQETSQEALLTASPEAGAAAETESSEGSVDYPNSQSTLNDQSGFFPSSESNAE